MLKYWNKPIVAPLGTMEEVGGRDLVCWTEGVGGRDLVCWTEGVGGRDLVCWTEGVRGVDTDPEGGVVPVSFGNTICTLHKFSVQQQKYTSMLMFVSS